MARTNEHAPDAFVRAVETALDHFSDPVWLGAHSPLATPYFLGHTLDAYAQGTAVQRRGQALQAALRNAADQLDAEARTILRTVFFERNPRLDSIGLALALHLSERTFYRNKQKAILELAHGLNQSLLPTLRAAAPAYKSLVGRTQIRESCLQSLRVQRSVYISGVSGTGKTTLGAAIVKTWSEAEANPTALAQHQKRPGGQRAFWFTVRPGLNDHLANLLFALAYFLRNLGAAQTWRQLVADQGQIQAERSLGLLRYDLQTVRATPVLICIDEVDLLQSESAEHAQIIHLLEELSQVAPLLLIGQRVVMQSHEYHNLVGFTTAELHELFAQRGVPQPEPAFQQQLIERTRGNPALLTLVLTLHELGDPLEESLQSLTGAPSVEGLLARIWRRLGNQERYLLMQLAHFRSPSPTDAWTADRPTLDLLLQRELVQSDNHGGIQIAPYLRTLVYERTPADLRPTLHLQAGAIREARADYLAAIYHATQGKQPALAVWLWYANRGHEVEQGRGAAALTLLKNISSADLADERDRHVLHTVRAELYKQAGQLEEAEDELASIRASRNSSFSAYVQQLRGDVLDLQGRVEQALVSYREALEGLTGSSQHRIVTLHTRIGFFQEFRFQNRTAARREALLARIKAEGFHGNIEEMAGNYQAAKERYEAAHQLALSLGDDNLDSLSRTYSQLGVLALRQGDYATAIAFTEQAIDCDHKRGDLVSPLPDQLNLSYTYLLAGNAVAADRIAREGLTLAERLGNRYWIAWAAAGVSEACYALQHFTDAERFAIQSLQQEEAFFRAAALVILGLVRQEQNLHEQAVKLLYEAIDSARDTQDKFTEAYATHMLGKVFHINGESDSALNALHTATELYSELNLAHKLEELQEVLQSWVE